MNPTAVVAAEVASRVKKSILPEPFASRMTGRDKKPLGDVFGLSSFGVNLTRLVPGAGSALLHTHTTQDEFVYVLQGRLTLRTNDAETELTAGMCAGFKGGSGHAHQLLNRSSEDAVFLEVGDRLPGDAVSYPEDDLQGHFRDGAWHFTHKDGAPYP